MRLIAPLIRMIADDDAILMEDYCCCIPAHRDRPAIAIVVRQGFIFDGQSIPRLLWRDIGHPFQGRSLPAALIHDALYRSELLPRDHADQIYRHLLDNGATLSAIKWAGVRAAGWLTWRTHTPASIAAARLHVRIYPRAVWTGAHGCQDVTCSRHHDLTNIS
jgi:hypothetical protein